jgi:large subunit ribosomal protein L30
MAYLKVTWKKSAIGRTERQRRVIESLGLKRLHHSVVHKDTPSIRGMVHKVTHLLEVEELAEAPETTSEATS